MDTAVHKTLILDTDPDTLIALQQVLEDGGIDATTTWDEAEACQLLNDGLFDLILIGDHPPEINAAAVIDDLSFRGNCPRVLILKEVVGEKDAGNFTRLGAIGVTPKRDPLAVLEQVTNALAPRQFDVKCLALSKPDPCELLEG